MKAVVILNVFMFLTKNHVHIESFLYTLHMYQKQKMQHLKPKDSVTTLTPRHLRKLYFKFFLDIK